MPRRGNPLLRPIPRTPRRPSPYLGVALHAPAPSNLTTQCLSVPPPRLGVSFQHPPPWTHHQPRLGVALYAYAWSPICTHALPMPRPCLD
ncbi:hypothetical protein PIB30_105206, partial [Stylosanthes scabra]|nr:hypothetical protein [Stylosanthes scabra]